MSRALCICRKDLALNLDVNIMMFRAKNKCHIQLLTQCFDLVNSIIISDVSGKENVQFEG